MQGEEWLFDWLERMPPSVLVTLELGRDAHGQWTATVWVYENHSSGMTKEEITYPRLRELLVELKRHHG